MKQRDTTHGLSHVRSDREYRQRDGGDQGNTPDASSKEKENLRAGKYGGLIKEFESVVSAKASSSVSRLMARFLAVSHSLCVYATPTEAARLVLGDERQTSPSADRLLLGRLRRHDSVVQCAVVKIVAEGKR